MAKRSRNAKRAQSARSHSRGRKKRLLKKEGGGPPPPKRQFYTRKGRLVKYYDAAASYIVLRDKAGRIQSIFLEKNRDDYAIKERRGQFRAYGGFADPGETPEAGLLREFGEELTEAAPTLRKLFNENGYRLATDTESYDIGKNLQLIRSSVYVTSTFDPQEYNKITSVQPSHDGGKGYALSVSDIAKAGPKKFTPETWNTINHLISNENYRASDYLSHGTRHYGTADRSSQHTSNVVHADFSKPKTLEQKIQPTSNVIQANFNAKQYQKAA